MDEAFVALTLDGPQRRALGQGRDDGFVGGGRDGDADHADGFRTLASLTRIGSKWLSQSGLPEFGGGLMSVAAGGYVLKVPPDRRSVLLEYHLGPLVAEPVSNFEHSRHAPLVVFASFEDGQITHIADGRKGASAGTGLVRLNMQDLEALARPIRFDQLEANIPTNVRAHLRRVLGSGGLLPPKTLRAFVDRIIALDPSIEGRLARFSERRREAIRGLGPRARENLALQKEALGIALEISGIPRDELLAWGTIGPSQQSFLDGLPGAQVREDAMLLADFSTMPGFEAIGEITHYGSKTFASTEDSRVRLTVIMANRLPLEQQTGADLIYFNEAYHSFVESPSLR